ncbi:MAG: TusE/DsrC/DsvC family sulfur relay protein [Thiobacillus sp.]|jgi:tRNA 2-thiouridine synthesizing protein E|nr:TusE/DsrC/DsvC family sulfur relay protein [Gammaproteobacteria bacterium]MDP1923220.1 TusE/DsrC/DsvC family sulfur relay protein [Thiobacillus sp.]
MSNTQLDASGSAVFDRDGFWIDPATWSESLADRVAQDDGLGQLNELQLSLLQALRNEFFKHGTVPALHHVCHLIGQDPDCMQYLFPSPREAWRLAGLPNPGEEAKSYL